MRTAVAMVAVWLFLAGSLRAQSTLEQPQLGLMLDRAGAARPIYGVAGSVTFGDSVATGATAVACSKRICLLSYSRTTKVDGSFFQAVRRPSASVRLVGAESAILSLERGALADRLTGTVIDVGEGPALFALDGDAAWVYFPRSRRLVRWASGQEPVDAPVPELAANGAAIVGLRVRKGDLEFAVVEESGTWIQRSDGSIVDFVTDGMGPVLLLQHGLLFATSDSLVLRRSDGSEMRFEVAGVDGLFEFGEGYVEARTAAAVYAIRTEPGREQMFLLPEMKQ